MDDNLYPNDGQFFGVPLSERKKEAVEEQKEVERLEPLLKASIARLKKQIKFYSSIHSIDESVLTDSDAFMHAVAGYKIAVTVLEKELSVQEGLYKQYLR